MKTAQPDRVIPPLKLPATGDQVIDLKALRGKNVVLYFYPKDSTPGCTTEGQDFAAHHARFKRANTVILGVSRDSLASHEKFRIFDVIKEKNLYGRKFMGIERSTFLIDEQGKLRREWRKVKVKGHVEEVLDAIKAL